jgi:hypothetical protein
MPQIHELIPNAEDLLELEPVDLAPVLLQYICSGSASSSGATGSAQDPIKRGNFFSGPPHYARRV